MSRSQLATCAGKGISITGFANGVVLAKSDLILYHAIPRFVLAE
jgi:hypothetical protein